MKTIPLLVAVLAAPAFAQSAQPEIRGVIYAGAKPVLVKSGFHALEGPVGLPDGGIYFSDITENRTYKLDDKGNISVWRENTKGANGLLLAKDGRLLCAEGDGKRIISVSPDGMVTALATGFNGKPLRAPNDLIEDRKGGIYFTDPGPRLPSGAPPLESGSVYYIKPGGEVILIDDEIRRPNGITLSLNGSKLYVDDTEGQLVYVFDVRADGSVKNKRPLVRLHDPETMPWGTRSRADGLAIDSEGRLYFATSSGIQVVDGGGKYLGTIYLPDVARNVAFAGPARQTLYMTTLTALYKIDLISKGPAGRAK
jgi:gluconolactonase